MKKAIATMMLLAGGLFAAPHVRFGVDIGVRAPVAVVRPACPGPGYTWTDGYWRAPVVHVAPVVHFDARRDFHDRDHFRR